MLSKKYALQVARFPRVELHRPRMLSAFAPTNATVGVNSSSGAAVSANPGAVGGSVGVSFGSGSTLSQSSASGGSAMSRVSGSGTISNKRTAGDVDNGADSGAAPAVKKRKSTGTTAAAASTGNLTGTGSTAL